MSRNILSIGTPFYHLPILQNRGDNGIFLVNELATIDDSSWLQWLLKGFRPKGHSGHVNLSRLGFPDVGLKSKPAQSIVSVRREDNALYYRCRLRHIWPHQSCISLNAASGNQPVDVAPLNSRVQFIPCHFRGTSSAFKMMKPCRRRSKLLLAPSIPNAFDIAERP